MGETQPGLGVSHSGPLLRFDCQADAEAYSKNVLKQNHPFIIAAEPFYHQELDGPCPVESTPNPTSRR